MTAYDLVPAVRNLGLPRLPESKDLLDCGGNAEFEEILRVVAIQIAWLPQNDESFMTPKGSFEHALCQFCRERYGLTDLFKTPEKRTHALLGVSAGLTVTTDSSGAAPPSADVTARLSKEAFEVDTTALSNEQVVVFRSEDVQAGTGSPLIGLFRLTDKTDVDGVLAWLKNGIPPPHPGRVDWRPRADAGGRHPVRSRGGPAAGPLRLD